jgi:hypothetical protein
MSDTTQFEEFISTLQTLIDNLDDRAMSMLRDTIDAGGTKPSAGEKKVVQARRALEKAVTLLREIE